MAQRNNRGPAILSAVSPFLLGFTSALPFILAVGPVAVLLVNTGMRFGFRRGSAAALGVATADTTYAMLAAAAGTAITHWLTRYQDQLRLGAAGVLAVVGITMIVTAYRSRPSDAEQEAASEERAASGSPLRTGAAFFAITISNPLTIVAFGSLAISTGKAIGLPWALGVGTASVVCHLALAGFGHSLGNLVSEKNQHLLHVIGGIFILGIAARTVASVL